MEKAKSERIKEFLLISFVLTGVLLSVLLWASALSERDPQSTGLYRGIEYSILITRTVEVAPETPAPTREHEDEPTTSTPGAEIQVTIIPPEEVDQDN